MLLCYFEEDEEEEEMFIGLIIFIENINKNISVLINNMTITRMLMLLGNRKRWQ